MSPDFLPPARCDFPHARKGKWPLTRDYRGSLTSVPLALRVFSQFISLLPAFLWKNSSVSSVLTRYDCEPSRPLTAFKNAPEPQISPKPVATIVFRVPIKATQICQTFVENWKVVRKLSKNSLFNSGPKKPWQQETWQDLSIFLRLDIGPFSPHLGAISLLNYTSNLDRKEKIHWRTFEKCSGDSAPTLQILSLVVVERALINK